MTALAETGLFDEDQVLKALESVVKGKEGYIDPRSKHIGQVCKYVLDGEPSCIVGQALSYLHVSTRAIAEMDHLSDPMFREDGAKHLAQYGVTFTEGALEILAAAQGEQDGGRTWGVALDTARLTHSQYMS